MEELDIENLKETALNEPHNAIIEIAEKLNEIVSWIEEKKDQLI